MHTSPMHHPDPPRGKETAHEGNGPLVVGPYGDFVQPIFCLFSVYSKAYSPYSGVITENDDISTVLDSAGTSQ